MLPDTRAAEIANKFAYFVKQKDVSLIEGISEDELENTLTQYAKEKGRGQPFYDAMERKLEKLRMERLQKLSGQEKVKERWRGRIESIIVGVIVAIIGLMIQSHFFPNTK